MRIVKSGLQIIMATFLLAIGSTLGAEDVYKCTDQSGATVYQESPCTSGTESIHRFEDTNPSRPSEDSEADSAARSLGFTSFEDYQQSRQICMDMLSDVDLGGYGGHCGADLDCHERQADEMYERMDSVARSPEWRRNKCDTILQAESGSDDDSYIIENSHDNELFIINDETFEARTYCYGMEKGDEVIFLDGSPRGACATAEVLNLRTKDRCDLRCE